MKKQIILSVIFLLMMATGALAAEDLFLKVCPQEGPEHGSCTKYFVLKSKEKSREIKDSVSGNQLFNGQTMRVDKIVDYLFIIGEGFDYDRIIMASKGVANQETKETIEEEAGFSYWGFVKKYQMKTPVLIYSRLAKSPLIVSVTEKFVHSSKSNFHFGTILALLVLFLAGLEISEIIFSFKPWCKKQWSAIKNSVNGFELFELIFLFAINTYCLVWSYHVGPPFIYLGAVAILIGFIIAIRTKIILKRSSTVNPDPRTKVL
jgi:hypothetical protein